MNFLNRYVRIISGCLAFWYYEDSNLFFVFYFISYFLDCIDGFAARYFNQATRFGQMLDMVSISSYLVGRQLHPEVHRAGHRPVLLCCIVGSVGPFVHGSERLRVSTSACPRSCLPLLPSIFSGPTDLKHKA